MRIILEHDSTIKMSFVKILSVLKLLCKSVEFISTQSEMDFSPHTTGFIDFDFETQKITDRFSRKEFDLCIYFTSRAYSNNFFSQGSANVVIISLANWQHYTSLPIENGFLYFIACYIAHAICPGLTHDDKTGCLSDFLNYKPGIDTCLKMGYICPECLHKIEQATTSSPSNKLLYQDVVSILDAIANTSKWGQSVFTILSEINRKDLNWATFEDYVADYYRSIGADVKQNINMSGFQVDILVSENTPSGEIVRSVVECKFYKAKVGNRIVNDFARIIATVKEAGETEHGVLVSFTGFTQDAHLAAKAAQIKLLQYKDILHKGEIHRKQPSINRSLFKETIPPEIAHKQHKLKKKKDIFVIMPFASDMDDLYYFGIHGSIQECNAVCIRMDDVAFTGGVLEKIYEHIRNASIIIAEVSKHNPNVYYELGHAHALNKQVILLTNNIETTPFDISGFNHILYKNIKDLRTKLTKRLKAILAD